MLAHGRLILHIHLDDGYGLTRAKLQDANRAPRRDERWSGKYSKNATRTGEEDHAMSKAGRDLLELYLRYRQALR